MLKVLDNESGIKKARQQFVEKIEQISDKRVLVKIGHLGESYEAEISWVSKLDIWILSEKIPGRYWNAFGIGKPSEGLNVSITCEVNFPLNGINRRIGGAFAEDGAGDIFVVHRGRIGGGRKGIGKSLFEDNYRGEWTLVEDGGIENTVALIGALNSPRFTSQVSLFVHEVDRIKGLVSSRPSQFGTSRDDHGFKEEFAGKKRYKVGEDVEAKCDHGLIVNDLYSALQSLGRKVTNDKNRDLYIVNSEGQITNIFEIKTDVSTTSLYMAVGQLLLNNVDLENHPRLILTIPEKVSKVLESKLNKLGIELLTYKWSGNEAVFPDLNSLNL